MTKSQKIMILRIIISVLFTFLGIVLSGILPPFVKVTFFIAAAIIAGFNVFIEAVENLVHGHILDENFLMTLSSIGAFAISKFTEGAYILILYQIGELFQNIAAGKSRDSIKDLMNIRPDYANLVTENGILEAEPENVEKGSTIKIFPGEKVPVDCLVLSGESQINTAALTGESLPKYVKSGDSLISGSINESGTLVAKTTESFENSAVSKILGLVENASERKSKAENFVTEFAKFYTPIVVIMAILLFVIPTAVFGNYSVWLYRSVSFLVISCPCALVVSVPLAFFGAIGGAARIGVLVKGSNYLEKLATPKTVAFDKTGTLTTGTFKVIDIIENNCAKEEILLLAAACEGDSPHPIAKAIKDAAGTVKTGVTDCKTIAGKGASALFNGKLLLAGSKQLLAEHNVYVLNNNIQSTAVHISLGSEYLGCIIVGDTEKPNAANAVTELKKCGIEKTVMLTGDNKSIAEAIAGRLNIDAVFAELMPYDKVAALEKLMSESHGTTVFAGDGINDAPVIKRADIGIAMGALGSDAAIEAADIVIMNDNPESIASAIKISRKAAFISKQNIFLAILVKISQLVLSALGITGIYMAVFADVGVLILAVLNSMRTLINRK